jgi:two-component system chemotaxis sensor kinase CheA
MVRNAVDHGLEASPADRLAAGKNEAGHVTLRAFHRGGSIYIEIEDDGRGLDRDVIVRKAIDKGLITDAESMPDRDVWNLIFEPGFSTAKQITDVSGRGVGMDVVRRNIEALRGQVEIASEKGVGTKFSIKLPLTLAIIDGMVVRVGRERYIIPTLSVVRSVRPTDEELFSVVNKGEMLSLQGALLPMFRLEGLFGVHGALTEPTEALVVVVEDDGKQAGVMVDELLGQQQIVIKSLGDAMRGIPGISGGAIMSDGGVSLILDVGGLVRLAHSGNHSNAAAAAAAGGPTP